MKSILPRLTVLGLAAGISVSAVAQNDVPIEYIPARNFTFSIGYRGSAHAPKVRFGQLGSIPSRRTITPFDDEERALQKQQTRVYDNGLVDADGPREAELDADGRQTSTPGGRYTTTTTTTTTDPDTGVETTTTYQNGDFLAFTPGRTRRWRYLSDNQVQPNGNLAMSNFSATTDGAAVSGEGESGGGFEVKLERLLGRRGNRLEWGIAASFGLNDINVKTSERIRATLTTYTDFYSFPSGFSAPGGGYIAPSTADFTDPVTGTVTAGGLETTTPLNYLPVGSQTTTEVGGAEIQGAWQIKGAYYIARLGPNVRYKISEKFALAGGLGVSGAFVGTLFRVDEFIVRDDVFAPLRREEESRISKFIPGFYAEMNAEWWLSERTGFYGGVVYETLGSYKQRPLSGRTADVDLGSGAGFRFGIITRF